ncbi:hypothetical protein [Selenomonas sputigena]
MTTLGAKGLAVAPTRARGLKWVEHVDEDDRLESRPHAGRVD